MGWISVKEKLPEGNRTVPVISIYHGLGIGMWDSKRGLWRVQPYDRLMHESHGESVVFWFSLPDLPRQQMPFCVLKRAALMSPLIAGPWGVYHTAKGWVCDSPNEQTANDLCDRLNKLWRHESRDRPTEQPETEPSEQA